MAHGRSGADCAAAVRERDLQIAELHAGILAALTIVELDAADQACADAEVVDLTQCESLVTQRRPEIEAALLERVRAAASLSELDARTEECEDAFVASCATVANVRKPEVNTALQGVRTVPNLQLLDAALNTSAGRQEKMLSF